VGQLHKDIIRRHGLATAGAMVFSLLFLVGYFLQLTQLTFSQLLLIYSSYWLVHLGMLYWVCTGRSARYKDPSLTIPTMLWSIIYTSVMLLFAKELRPVLMLAYLAVMPFGVFLLGWKGFLGICLFTMSCYTGVVLYLQHNSVGLWIPELEAILGITFLASIMAYTFIGREFSILRNAYKKKNRELRRAMVRIEELAVTDELTGLYNRRYLLRTLEKQRALANREGLPFVLAFVDIDHFKQINDHHGHRIGDQVLAELSLQLKMSIREVDLAARYGGEEFVLLLSGLALDDAGKVLDRIRVRVTEKGFSEANIPLTVSIGVAQYHAGEDGEELLNRADRLLYEAKRAGRNRVKMEPVEMSLFPDEVSQGV
jgi:diguanylate cyclase (GGDEF)-like protein